MVGVANDGREAVEKALDLLPDVVIMDAQMPNMDGLEATRYIKDALPRVAVLFLSVFTDYLEASRAVGADSYLAKDCKPEDLFTELQRVGTVRLPTRQLPKPTVRKRRKHRRQMPPL